MSTLKMLVAALVVTFVGSIAADTKLSAFDSKVQLEYIRALNLERQKSSERIDFLKSEYDFEEAKREENRLGTLNDLSNDWHGEYDVHGNGKVFRRSYGEFYVRERFKSNLLEKIKTKIAQENITSKL